MTDEEFAKLPLDLKWSHIRNVIDYITTMDKAYDKQMRGMKKAHSHQVKEQDIFNFRLDQLQRWGHIKDLYATHRDELENTLDIPAFQECKSIIERVFTMELDDALRGVLDEE